MDFGFSNGRNTLKVLNNVCHLTHSVRTLYFSVIHTYSIFNTIIICFNHLFLWAVKVLNFCIILHVHQNSPCHPVLHYIISCQTNFSARWFCSPIELNFTSLCQVLTPSLYVRKLQWRRPVLQWYTFSRTLPWFLLNFPIRLGSILHDHLHYMPNFSSSEENKNQFSSFSCSLFLTGFSVVPNQHNLGITCISQRYKDLFIAL